MKIVKNYLFRVAAFFVLKRQIELSKCFPAVVCFFKVFAKQGKLLRALDFTRL